MEVLTVAFFGHRYVDNLLKVEDALYEHIKWLITENEYVEFLVGRNGDFDACVSSTIKRAKKNVCDDNSSHILVLPYVTSEYINNQSSFEEYYDDISIYDIASRIYPKAVIGLRNAEMVDSADLVICYLERESGGAYNAVKYAEKQGKKIINIATQINHLINLKYD